MYIANEAFARVSGSSLVMIDVTEIDTAKPIGHPGQRGQDRLPGVDIIGLATTESIGTYGVFTEATASVNLDSDRLAFTRYVCRKRQGVDCRLG